MTADFIPRRQQNDVRGKSLLAAACRVVGAWGHVATMHPITRITQDGLTGLGGRRFEPALPAFAPQSRSVCVCVALKEGGGGVGVGGMITHRGPGSAGLICCT